MRFDEYELCKLNFPIRDSLRPEFKMLNNDSERTAFRIEDKSTAS